MLAKTKLNSIKVLVSTDLIDSYISHDNSFSLNKVLKEYNKMSEEIKNPKNAVSYTI